MLQVILIDVNILIYATDTRSHRHVEARDWFNQQLSGSIRVGLPWNTLLGYIAIEHGLTLCSTDGDFARFRSLKWENPLAP